MPLHILLLILFAAFLHASWNALLRADGDRLWSMTVMCLAVALASLVGALWLPAPARASWPCGVLSAVLHVGYNLFLVRSYRAGDLGQTYPIARGCSPMLVTLGAVWLAGETMELTALLGIALVSLGIIVLSLRGRRLGLPSLPYALGTGCFIAAYSVTDGIGVRLSGAPMAYTAWMCAMWGLLMPLVFVALRGARALWPTARKRKPHTVRQRKICAAMARRTTAMMPACSRVVGRMTGRRASVASRAVWASADPGSLSGPCNR